MKNRTMSLIVLGLFAISLSLVLSMDVASAHAWGFDPSYTNYSLKASVARDVLSGKYNVNAEFALCKRNIDNMVFPTTSRSGVGWCSGDAAKCCAGGINEATGECNTNSCGMAYQVSCSIFGKTDPIKSCTRACMFYPQEAANYEQIWGGNTLTFVSSHPSCLQYGLGNTGAFISKRTFVLDTLTANTLISAGAEFRRTGDGDGWLGVPIYIKPLDYYNPTCSVNSDCGSVSSVLKCIGNSSFNVITTPTCSNGNCVAPSINNNFLENCQNGCNPSTGTCLPPIPPSQCTINDLSKCSGSVSSSLTCNVEGNSVNSTTRPGCLDGSCSFIVSNTISVCQYGCIDGGCLPFQPPVNDTTAPGAITNLVLVGRTNSTLSWSWANPTDSDFNSAIVYINGVNVVNTSNNHYMASGLMANTSYTITCLLYTSPSPRD